MYQVMSESFFWDESSSNRFTKIVESYGDRILMLLGSHTHFTDLRINLPNPKSTEEKKAKVVMMTTPSISPVNLNNPGFTLFNIAYNEVRDVRFNFFDLYMFPQTESEATFNTFSLKEEHGIDSITPNQIQDLINKLESNWVTFHRYLAHKIGYRGLTEVIGAGK